MKHFANAGGVNLGTYLVRVKCIGQEPFDYAWHTHVSVWKDEEELIESIRFMFTEGNYSCDCNLGDLIARHKGQPDPDLPCGGTLYVTWIDAQRPDGTWIKVYSGVD